MRLSSASLFPSFRACCGLASVGFCIRLAAPAEGAPKPHLFPVPLGNYWILESTLGTNQQIIRCEPGTNKLLHVTGLLDHSIAFYCSLHSSVLFRWDPALHRLRPTVSLRSNTRKRFRFTSANQWCSQELLQLEPVIGTIQAQAGIYSNCSVLSIMTTNSVMPGVCNISAQRIYFAPGVVYFWRLRALGSDAMARCGLKQWFQTFWIRGAGELILPIVGTTLSQVTSLALAGSSRPAPRSAPISRLPWSG